ncbi:uncharacterized protein [Diadema antillarum]|uniref:uncharacterized protein n=1 Tax=Diadema antillarum TaxID=105358 RepID=UPI003A8575CA
MAKKKPFHLRLRCSIDSEARKPSKKQSTVKLVNSNEAASRTTKWRHKLKANNPQEYTKLLKKAAEYNKLQRIEMSLAESTLKKRNISTEEKEKSEKFLEQKKRCNATAALRMRKMRAKKKEEQLRLQSNKMKQTPSTRAQDKRQKEKLQAQARKKRERRAAMSKEEHEQYNAMRREKYKQKKEKEKLMWIESQKLKAREAELKKEEERLKEIAEAFDQKHAELEVTRKKLSSAGCDVRSSSARRKSLERVRAVMPQDREKCVSTMIDLFQKSSPKKRAALKKRGMHTGLEDAHHEVQNLLTSSISEEMGRLKRSKKKKDLEKRRNIAASLKILSKYRLQKKGSALLQMGRKIISSASKKKQMHDKRKLSPEVASAVISFYEESAIDLPDKKMVSMKTMKNIRYLQQSVAALFLKFKSQNPDMKVGAKTFYSLRPHHVKLQGSIKFRACLCEYCTNIELKATAINNLAHSYGMKSFFDGVHSVNRVTMCPKSEGAKTYMRHCSERKCKECGPKLLRSYLRPLVEKHGPKHMTWKKWIRVRVDENGKTITKQQIVTNDGTVSQCLEELEGETVTISKHLHSASWQSQQFATLTKDMPNNWVVMVLDFAENFVCKYQDEIQSAHWYHTNVTIHPIVCYHRCPTCDETMQESLVFITGDNRHTYHAVHQFMSQAVQHLRQNMEIDKIIRFTDQCAAQYKSRGPFKDIALAQQHYQVPVEHHYFGARHGKGPSDGETAVVKRQASLAISSGRKVMNNAKDVYEFCQDELTIQPSQAECLHFQRKVFFVEEMNHNRDHKDVQTIKGTRQLHCVKGESSGRLWTRNLSCFCKGCVLGNQQCDSRGTVDDWKSEKLFAATIETSHDTGDTEDPSSMTVADDDLDADGPSSMTDADDYWESESSPSSSPVKQLHVTDNVVIGVPTSHPPSTSDRQLPVEVPTSNLLSTGTELHVEDQTSHSSTCDTQLHMELPTSHSPSTAGTRVHVTAYRQTQDLQTGDFVAVVYGKTWWVGEVLELKGEDAHINFLLNKGDNKYSWPDKPEQDWIRRTGIFAIFPSPPIPVSSRHLGFEENTFRSLATRINTFINLEE